MSSTRQEARISTSESPYFRKRFIRTTSSPQERINESVSAEFGGFRDLRGHDRFFWGCSLSSYAGMVV
jgi:hypothetical protein